MQETPAQRRLLESIVYRGLCKALVLHETPAYKGLCESSVHRGLCDTSGSRYKEAFYTNALKKRNPGSIET